MKTIKSLIYLSAAGLLLFTACEKKQPEGETKDTTAATQDTTATGVSENFNIDTTASIVKWVGKKTVGSDKHLGTVKIQSGALAVAGGKVTGGSIVIDMNSIQSTDVTDAGKKAKLEGHLKADDFFNAAKYPTATFVITKVEGNTATGNLTLRDSTSTISVNFDATQSGDNFKVTGKTTIDRSKFGVKYGSGSFFKGLGDKAISDEIELEFDVVGKK